MKYALKIAINNIYARLGENVTQCSYNWNDKY